jgi:hypothetical protein
MDRITDLNAVVRDVVQGYVRPSPNATMYFMNNPEQGAYAAISVPHAVPNMTRVVAMAHVTDEKVIIDTDISNKPLYEALLQAGIPQQQIVLAYQGEKQPMS